MPDADLMAFTAQPIHAVTAVAALGGAFAALGHPVDVGAGTAAALAAIEAEPAAEAPAHPR